MVKDKPCYSLLSLLQPVQHRIFLFIRKYKKHPIQKNKQEKLPVLKAGIDKQPFAMMAML